MPVIDHSDDYANYAMGEAFVECDDDCDHIQCDHECIRDLPAMDHSDDLAKEDAAVVQDAKYDHMHCTPKRVREVPAVDHSDDYEMGDAIVKRTANAITYSAIESAYEKCQQWELLL